MPRTSELAPEDHRFLPKTVLTLDHYRTGITGTGVRIVNLIDWLPETDV
ncbi:MAG: hypothetical protein ACLTQI_02390 [Slackia sp.]